LLPSREEEMLSDSITFAGHSITTFQMLGLGALLLGVAAMLLAFARGRRTTLRRSEVTEGLTAEMARIAEALERIADQGASRMMRRAAQDAASATSASAAPAAKGVEPVPETPPAPRRIAYSMFGR
jgi:hypothetical protein